MAELHVWNVIEEMEVLQSSRFRLYIEEILQIMMHRDPIGGVTPNCFLLASMPDKRRLIVPCVELDIFPAIFILLS